MDATIDFDLSSPDDATAFKLAPYIMDMGLALWEIQANAWRHKDDVDSYRAEIDRIINNIGIDLDKIIE